ncbi:MAG: hypothetical protein HYS32_01840 [Candidatus Woesearchaeota archaeon]|nr:MAG: hypothetical protein HYS32_01840 [Candidatus Woesearchaeota archaeon]
MITEFSTQNRDYKLVDRTLYGRKPHTRSFEEVGTVVGTIHDRRALGGEANEFLEVDLGTVSQPGLWRINPHQVETIPRIVEDTHPLVLSGRSLIVLPSVKDVRHRVARIDVESHLVSTA